jgi:hypothetical protein
MSIVNDESVRGESSENDESVRGCAPSVPVIHSILRQSVTELPDPISTWPLGERCISCHICITPPHPSMQWEWHGLRLVHDHRLATCCALADAFAVPHDVTRNPLGAALLLGMTTSCTQLASTLELSSMVSTSLAGS